MGNTNTTPDVNANTNANTNASVGNQMMTPPAYKPKDVIDNGTRIFLKILTIAVISIMLILPTFMIDNTISERENTAMKAMSEVFTQWGGSQLITGPYVTITKEFETITNDKTATKNKTLTVLPNDLSIRGDINSKELKRGIFEIVSYNTPLLIEGSFRFSGNDMQSIGKYKDGHALINFSISDLKGISEEMMLRLGNKTYNMVPNGESLTQGCKELSAQIDTDMLAPDTDIPFSLSIKLKGSQSLNFAPIARKTSVRIKSNCQTPSFIGEFIPSEREVSDSGFSAEWDVLYVNRNYPQIAEEFTEKYDISDYTFGVKLMLPVQHYQKTERSLKYAFLIIILTFVAFFFIEMLMKKNVNFMQYTLVGLALVLFYSLLLSFSEHLGFNMAYLVAAIMTIALITVYVAAILKITKTALCIGGALAMLYTYIFVLIQMETYALMAGSIGLFVILAVVMYFSQKISWGGKNEQPHQPITESSPVTESMM